MVMLLAFSERKNNRAQHLESESAAVEVLLKTWQSGRCPMLSFK